jgi:hypothetical protein
MQAGEEADPGGQLLHKEQDSFVLYRDTMCTAVTAVTGGYVPGDRNSASRPWFEDFRKEIFLSRGDTRRQWKGEAAASFVYKGMSAVGRYRPPAPAAGS